MFKKTVQWHLTTDACLTLIQITEPMKDASEDEQYDDLLKIDESSSKPRTSHAERAEQLRKMMDDNGK